MPRFTKKHNQRGIASIIVVSILVILLALVSIGFSRLINRDVTLSVEDQKSRIASYAAESGVNEVIKYLKQGNSLTSVNQTNCRNNLLTALNANKGLSGDKSTEYTCVLLNLNPSSLGYGKLPPLKSKVIQLKSSPPLSNILLTWQGVSNTGFVNKGSSNLLDDNTWNQKGYMPVLRVSIYAVPSNNSLSGPNYLARTLFLYPRSSNGSTAIGLTGPSAIADGNLVPVDCKDQSTIGKYGYPGQDPSSCSVVLDNLPNLLDDGSYYYIRLTPIYGAANVSISAHAVNSVALKRPSSNNIAASAGVNSAGGSNVLIKQAASSCTPCPGFTNCDGHGNAITWCYYTPCSSYFIQPSYCKNHTGVCLQAWRAGLGPPDKIYGCDLGPSSSSSSGSSGGSSSGGSSSSSSSSSSGGGGNGGGGGVQFVGVQADIDVTAQSNDVVKRLLARVDLSSASVQSEIDNLPEYGLQSADTICKRYVVTPAGTLVDPAAQGQNLACNGLPQPPPSLKPDVRTLDATGLNASSVDLNGTVQPNATSATYYFEYAPGQNPSPGEKTTDLPPAPGDNLKIDKGTSTVYPIMKTLNGNFLPGDFYHYRACALNPATGPNNPVCGVWKSFGFNQANRSKVVTVKISGYNTEDAATAQVVVLGKNGSQYVCTRSAMRAVPDNSSLTLVADATNCPDNDINGVGVVEIFYNNGKCDPNVNVYDCYYHHSWVNSVTYKFDTNPAKPVAFSSNGACKPGKGTLVDGSKFTITCNTSPYVLNLNGVAVFKTTNP